MKAPKYIYSSESGGFERAWSPLRQTRDIGSILVSDSIRDALGWDHHSFPSAKFSTHRLTNRFHKMLYYQTLSNPGISVYLDANVRAKQSLMPIFDAFERSGADIGMYRHYARSSVREEAFACLERGKIPNPSNLWRELDFYENCGFPDRGGMWEGSVIFRRHSSSILGPAMNEWWELYSRFQTRDQFSLPFIIWKHGLKVLNLDDHSPGREHYFTRLQHSEKGMKHRLARYLQARAPEHLFWSSLQSVARTLARH